MRKLLLFGLIAVFVSACSKDESRYQDGSYIYYSEDYKNANMTILGHETSEIESVWFELYSDEYDSSCPKALEADRYMLIVKRNGKMTSEMGSIETDWQTTITFHPENGDPSYEGTWSNQKDRFIISYDLVDRTEEVSFVYKDEK